LAPFFDVYGCIIHNQPDMFALRIPKAVIVNNLAPFAALADRTS
jgi:hypothetical protein